MKRQSIVPVAMVVVIVLVLVALIYITFQAKNPEVGLISNNGTVFKLQVEIADSWEEQKTGLMNRSSMDLGAGMLFVFDNDGQRSFWMENTLIPLDMIFIANNLTIIDIHENATPLSQDIIESSGPCRYVLEVNGGLCAADDIDVGDRVMLDLN